MVGSVATERSLHVWRNMYPTGAGTLGYGTRSGPQTTVSDRGTVTIPADFRRRLDIEPGDTLRWSADDEGHLSVEVVHERAGVFDGFEPVAAGETNAVEV
jgi:AbrB family looped-hinge helix DNA binding protein